MLTDMINTLVWAFGGILGLVVLLLGTLWSMTRREKEIQDEAIDKVRQDKADKAILIDAQFRYDREFDRVRDEQTRLFDKADERHQRELAAMENRLSSKIDLILELLKKEYK